MTGHSIIVNPGCDIVIPTWNRVGLTLSAVASVENQSYPYWNLYVIDDASSGQNLTELQFQLSRKKDSRIQLVSLTGNKGPSYCRNLGAELGQNNYLAFLDSDDAWREEKLERQLAYLERNPEIGYVHCDEQWLRHGQEIKQGGIHRKSGGYFFERAISRCLISPSAILFRRSFWDILSDKFLPSFRVAEDFEFWLRLNFEYPAGYVDEKLVIKQAGNWSQLSQTKEIDRQRVLALHRFLRLYQEDPRFQPYQKVFCDEVMKKLNILKKGAAKYGHTRKSQTYSAWEKAFMARLTKVI